MPGATTTANRSRFWTGNGPLLKVLSPLTRRFHPLALRGGTGKVVSWRVWRLRVWLRAGRLPGRGVGPVIIGERRIRSKAAFKSATRRAEQAGMKALEAEIEKPFKGTR